MNVKRYVVNDMSEAMNKIKYELGPDAVILSTRNIRRKGIKGFFQKPVIEVVAAYENKADKIKNETIQSKENVEYKGNNDFQSVLSQYSKVSKNDDLDALELERKLDNVNKMVESLIKSAKGQQNEVIGDKVEVAKIPDVKVTLSKDYEKNYSDKLKNLVNLLIANDVDEEIAYKLGDEVKEILEVRKDADELDVLKLLLQDYIGAAEPIPFKKYRRRVVVLAGPTGIGKTTTIAKLASIFSLKHEAKVCLATADTYRIAAVEQLKTYAEILKIPFEVIDDIDNIEEILKYHEDKDIVLIDTAGRSPTDKAKIDETVKLIERAGATDVYLVVSATTSYKGIKHIIDNYKDLKDYKLIFTKVDETPSLGNILNVTYTVGRKVGYLTFGQNVPDDIEEFDSNKVVNSLLGID